MADGLFEIGTPHPDPRITTCDGFPGFCDGEYFHHVAMGRTDSEVDALGEEAKVFFLQRFGIDADNDDAVVFQQFGIDPRIRYRARTVSGRSVDSKGWKIQDGGFLLQVLEERVLGGERAGIVAPAGAMMVFGNYKIIPKVSWWDWWYASREPIIINYQTWMPMQFLADGSATIQCELSHDEWGGGQAMGLGNFTTFEDGRAKFSWRNVLTFPPLGSPTPNQ